MISIRYELSVTSDVKQFIQSKTYEKIICNIMNQSSKLFPHTYRHVTEQSSGECDFIDNTTGKKYEAKILFSNTQCQLIAKGGDDSLLKWVWDLRKEIREASERLLNRDLSGIRETVLYHEMLSRLLSVADDEIGILFIMFPIVIECVSSVFLQFTSDILTVAYSAIVEDYPEKFKDKDTFVIYPSALDQKTVIRNLRTYEKEGLPIGLLSSYMTISAQMIPDNE